MKILVRTLPLITQVWCQFLLVSLSPEMVKEILKRRELFQMVKGKSGLLLSMSFLGVPGDFYDDLDFEAGLDAEQLADFVDEDFVVLPDDFEIPNVIKPSRTERGRLVIMEYDFNWAAMPKHGVVDVETPALPYDILLEGEKR